MTSTAAQKAAQEEQATQITAWYETYNLLAADVARKAEEDSIAEINQLNEKIAAQRDRTTAVKSKVHRLPACVAALRATRGGASRPCSM